MSDWNLEQLADELGAVEIILKSVSDLERCVTAKFESEFCVKDMHHFYRIKPLQCGSFYMGSGYHCLDLTFLC